MPQAEKSDLHSSPKEILTNILEKLKSANVEERAQAIATLGKLSYSSQAVLQQLEKIATADADKTVRAAALDALSFSAHQQIYTRKTTLAKGVRRIIVKEISKWRDEGLISSEIAQTIQNRYAFDLKRVPAKQRFTSSQTKPALNAIAAPPTETKRTPSAQTASAPAKKVSAPKQPSKPKRSLAQVLFSEASIKIALYLGAFFVIAAALIFAVIIEELRLPILLGVTAVFLIGALSLKKRLPQPSFTLFIIFSTLLAIDASVLADTLHLQGNAVYAYWTVIYLLIAALWGFSVWFYQSRFFSVAAFAALILSAIHFTEIFDTPLALFWLIATLTALLGLMAAKFLKAWKDQSFAKPLFLTSRVSLFIILSTSPLSFVSMFDSIWSNLWWLASGLTCALVAAGFAFSDSVIRKAITPFLTVAALIPISWITLNAFGSQTSPIQIFAAWGWGTIFVAVSAALANTSYLKQWKRYSLPLLLGSGFVLLGALTLAGIRTINVARNTALFFVFLGIAATYAAYHVYKPQLVFWSIALLSAISAYFSFFQLPFLKNVDVFAGYQLFGASILLLLPDSLLPRKVKEIPWRIPLQVLGAIATLYFISIPRETDLQAALLLGIMSAFFFFYAARLRVYLGYIATGFLSFSLLYASYIFQPDIWQPTLIGLATLFYGAGLLFRRDQRWSNVFRYSALGLGSIVILTAFASSQEAFGIYALLLAILFTLETFFSRSKWMEAGIHISLAIAVYGILHSFRIPNESAYVLLGIGLSWLSVDLILERTLNVSRPLRSPLRLFAGAVIALNTILLANILQQETLPVLIGFGAYAVYFFGYALYRWRAHLGYIFAAYLSLTAIALLQHTGHTDLWLPTLFALAACYYGIGFALKKRSAWTHILRVSGLALASALILSATMIAKEYTGWYAIALAIAFTRETFERKSAWTEVGIYISLAIAVHALLIDFNVSDATTYTLLTVSILWLTADAILERRLHATRSFTLRAIVLVSAWILVAANTVQILTIGSSLAATISFGVYAAFFAAYAVYNKEPRLSYLATGFLPLGILALLQHQRQSTWTLPLIGIAVFYYAIGYLVRRAEQAEWQKILQFSGMLLGTLVALSAPFEDSGIASSLPVAIAATLYAIEALKRRNVWLGFPANAFYLMAYFMILINFKVDQPQFFSVGAAALGMLMHYLLTRSGSKVGAFIIGMLSQLALLSVTYIQMVSEEKLIYFAVLFFQALVVLIYGIIIRSRSLVITPIVFLVVGVLTIAFGLLEGLPTILLIGCTGIFLIAFGVGALLLRERVADLRERLDDWNA